MRIMHFRKDVQTHDGLVLVTVITITKFEGKPGIQFRLSNMPNIGVCVRPQVLPGGRQKGLDCPHW